MRAFLQFLKSELKYILRNPVFFLILIATPVLLLTVSLMFIPSERNLEGISIGVYGEDKSFLGKYLADFLLGFLEQDNVFRIPSREEAMKVLDSGQVDGVIVIPVGFTANMLQAKPTYLSYIPSSASLLESVTIYKLLKTALGEIRYGAMIEMDLDEKMTPSPDVPVPELRIEGIQKNTLDYPDVMAPGILAFVILSTMLMGITGSVSREKDRGILDGFRITNSSRMGYVLGKFCAYSLLGSIQTVALIVGSIVFLNIHFEGSLWVVGFFLLSGMLTYLAIGLLISVLSSNSDISMGISAGIVFLMFLGGGVFFPVSQMPQVMQWVAPLLPVTHLTEALRKTMIAGKELGQLGKEIAFVLSFLAGALGFSLVSFKAATR
ncbi:MAG TPA: ABC transporter permease [Thermotogota bacterium]|nr:ABC transporter permease [Thermotogota bacterium]HRW92171.1 ABC transporter permease [Thermotogota bacterium]